MLPDELEFDFKREDILGRLRTNRDAHKEAFDESMKGYYLEVEEQAKEVATKARKAAKDASESKDPKELTFYVRARKPQDHTGDYDRVIDMLELAQQATVKLNEATFATYVRDEWDWKNEFTATSDFYNSKFGASLKG